MPDKESNAPWMELTWRDEAVELAPNTLRVVSFTGIEGVSELFDFRLELVSAADSLITAKQTLGRRATVEIRPFGTSRLFNGVVRRFTIGKRDERYRYYTASLAPDLWLATKRRRSRIFQRLSAQQIIEEVLRDLHPPTSASAANIPRIRFKLAEPGRKLNYCVQYEESDFDFVCRLMQDEGLFFCFEHSEDHHVLVIADRSYMQPELAGNPRLDFDEVAQGTRTESRIQSWSRDQEICSGKRTHWDFWFKDPARNLATTCSIGPSSNAAIPDFALGRSATLEVTTARRQAFQHDDVDPNRSKEGESIERRRAELAKLELERETSAALLVQGSGNVAGMVPGYRFKLNGHYEDDGDYFIVSTRHHAEQPLPDGTGSVADYHNKFIAFPNCPEYPYRPPVRVRRPSIPGTQTATVVGPEGDEIHVDSFGRVKIRFHWDPRTAADGDSSCWVRVSQIWAGKRFGAFFWPRTGQEVIVGFEDGDPDRPIVLGSVYNGDNMPPMELPAMKRVVGVKSCTVGGDPDFQANWLYFHDQPGDEHVHIHSETYECITSETSKFNFTSGPRLEVAEPTLPIVGSGAGGGVAANIAGFVWNAGFMASKSLGFEKLGAKFPLSEAKFTGARMDAIIGGDRTMHIMAGSDYQYQYLPERLLLGSNVGGIIGALLVGLGNFGFMGYKFGTMVHKESEQKQKEWDERKKKLEEEERAERRARGEKVGDGPIELSEQRKKQLGPKPMAPGAAVGMKVVGELGKALVTAILSPWGKYRMYAGVDFLEQGYARNRVVVQRAGKSETNVYKKFWTDLTGVGIFVKVLVIQIGAVNFLYDLLASNKLITEEKKYNSTLPDGTPNTEDRNVWWWMEWVAKDLGNMLSGILNIVEQKAVALKCAKELAEASAAEMEIAAKLALQTFKVDAMKGFAGDGGEKLKQSLHMVSKLAIDPKDLFPEAGLDNGDIAFNTDGKFNVLSADTSIYASDTLSASVSILARGGLSTMPTGVVTVAANKSATFSCWGMASLGLSRSAVGSDVTLHNAGTGSMVLRQGITDFGPKVELTEIGPAAVKLSNATQSVSVRNSEIEIVSGPPGAGTSMSFTPATTELKSKAVTVKAELITLQDSTGTNKIELGPKGIKLSGMTLEFSAQLLHQLRALTINHKS